MGQVKKPDLLSEPGFAGIISQGRTVVREEAYSVFPHTTARRNAGLFYIYQGRTEKQEKLE